MGCAIIGYGKMGRIRLHSLQSLGVEVKKVCDKNDEVDDSIFNNSEISTVFISTPNYLNKSLIVKALSKNMNVFCEKPPALNLAEMNEIIEAESCSSGKLMFGFNHRHHNSIKHMKRIIDSKDYGDILWMRGRYGKSVNSDFFSTWRADVKKSGGGILIDQGIHLLDLFLYMAGDFDEVHSFLTNSFWKIPGIEDNAFMTFKNSEKNITASLHSTMTQWRHIFSFEIFMERGWMVLNGLKTSSNSYGNEVLTISDSSNNFVSASPQETHEYTIDTSWESETRYFFNCIQKDKPIENGSLQDALKVMKIIDKIYKTKDF